MGACRSGLFYQEPERRKEKSRSKMKNPERNSMKKKKEKKRRKHAQHQQLIALRNPNSQTLFALILAALYSDDHSEKSLLVTRCLIRIRRSLSQNLSPPLLALLPSLLKSSCVEIATKSAEIVGAATLISIEMNEMIASECGVLRGLINLLGSSVKNVAMAACNAILDLSTASLVRQYLLQFSAIEKLILAFIKVPGALPEVVSLSGNANGHGSCPRIVFKEDDFTIALVDTAIILINSCSMKQLREIPRKLFDRLVINLKRLWKKVHKMMLSGTTLKCSEERYVCISNIRTSNLAESIFRLCINDCRCEAPLYVNEINRRIFDLAEMSFEQFILKYWEVSPLLFRGLPKASFDQEDLLSSFAKSFRSEKGGPSSLPSILNSLSSCPPIASDELDILHFLEEARNHFVCPITYQQDIRIVKTHHLDGEVHYFSGQSGTQATQFLLDNEILKCQDAYNEGYTIALRGMEFRFESHAAIANSLASLFGLPSAGVKMYLTPPNSQGLPCHSDDHCVFVCQLIGVKDWRVYPHSSLQLPRLYESIESWTDSELQKQGMAEGHQFLLKEGDVLYIPRGVPHEARTIVNEDGSAGFSLHLTLAIEIEPPFEWEGFIHVALDHWCEKQRESQHPFRDSMSWSLHVMSVHLLHVAIKLISDLDPTVRKASLVGAMSSSTVTESWLTMNQSNIFKYLIRRINAESKFFSAVERVETAVQNHENVFPRERWLQHLTKEWAMIKSLISRICSADTQNLFYFCSQRKDIVEAAFVQAKSKFCSEILIEDAEPCYRMVVESYKKVRKQYSNGMLSLHSTGKKSETKF